MGDREVEDKIEEEKEVERKKPQTEGQQMVTTLRIRTEMREIEDVYVHQRSRTDQAHGEQILITALRRSMADSVRASPVCGKAWQASPCLELGWFRGLPLIPWQASFDFFKNKKSVAFNSVHRVHGQL